MEKKYAKKKNQINKQKLASIIFNDEQSLHKLNAIIHPAVKKKFQTWVKQNSNSKYVIEEAAILIESGAIHDIDIIISVIANKKLRIERIKKRDNVNKSTVLSRMKHQISDKEKTNYSDYIINNDGNHSLIKQALKIHHKLCNK
ncbi:MAG: dephospho-CoA kinase [Bacteroidota bacterium]